MPTTLATGIRRTVIGVLLVTVLAMAVVVTLGATGRVTLAHERVPGQPEAILEEITGAETGPACPVDDRYVDERPKGLPPDVLDAWHRLRAEADEHGIVLCLNDGKRSAGQQQREFDDAVQRFGVRELAERYVLSPEESEHVTGNAVDIQPLASAAWAERNGREFGWCRRYQNEEWHFEYDPEYVNAGCPELLPSATGF